MKNGLIGRMKDILAGLSKKNGIDELDFVVLKTTLMLAAVDGEIAEEEIERFKELAAKCRGYSDESFKALWDAAVRSAGYLLLQSRFLEREELVATFVKEAEKGFVGEVALETSAERIRAFECLDRMAMADGERSSIEHECIEALVRKVEEVRESEIAARYPLAAKFGK